jgi:hypothetical protein
MNARPGARSKGSFANRSTSSATTRLRPQSRHKQRNRTAQANRTTGGHIKDKGTAPDAAQNGASAAARPSRNKQDRRTFPVAEFARIQTRAASAEFLQIQLPAKSFTAA